MNQLSPHINRERNKINCFSRILNVFMLGICIYGRSFFLQSVFKPCRLSRQSLNTASFPSILFTFSFVAYSDVIRFLRHNIVACMLALFSLVSNKHNWSCPSYFTVFVVFLLIKQLLDEVEHDIMNYQNRGLCYLPKPKAGADL